jgi:hypothetical protein
MSRLLRSACSVSRRCQILRGKHARTQTISSLKRYKSTNNNKPPVNQPPEIKIDPTKGNTVLHQKAARAAEVHAELNALLDKQAKRRAEEMNRPFGSGFVDFVKKSKSEMINIFAAFTCVLLAYQISNIRKGARKLLDEAGEQEVRMEELKKILRLLSNEEFSNKVATAYEERLKKSKLVEMEENGKKWLFASSKKKVVENEGTESENDKLFKDVLQNELRKTIGDSALSEFEVEEKKLHILQEEMGMIDTKKEVATSNNVATESSLGGLEQLLAEAQDDSADSDRKVVKRKGFI